MKRIYLILLAVATILIVFVVNNGNAKQDQVIYVAINGDDNNKGSKSKPFRTLQKAASEAHAGTTVFIREGTYHEMLVVQHSGTKSKPIIFRAYQKDKVVLSGKEVKDVEENTSLVTIHDKNYLTISGLIMENLHTDLTDETVMGIYVTGSSSHIILENNHVHGIETHAADGNAHGIAVDRKSVV